MALKGSSNFVPVNAVMNVAGVATVPPVYPPLVPTRSLKSETQYGELPVGYAENLPTAKRYPEE